LLWIGAIDLFIEWSTIIMRRRELAAPARQRRTMKFMTLLVHNLMVVCMTMRPRILLVSSLLTISDTKHLQRSSFLRRRNMLLLRLESQNNDQQHQEETRRSFLFTSSSTSSAALTTLFLPWGVPLEAVAVLDASSSTTTSLPAESLELAVGLLESRVDENVLAPPPYGMERSDISYPAWFRGTWKVVSTTASVEAPCGVALFGTNATFAAAQREVGTTLQYECRFVPTPDSSGCIADREFNVRRICQAVFGPNSVLDIPLATPNKLTAIVAPPGSPRPLQVDLFTVSRRQEFVDENHFDCSEVVREIVVGSGSGGGGGGGGVVPPPVLKEVETTSLYAYHPENNTVMCRQRSATFLLPSQSNPLQFRKWEMANGRPVDVRFYNVVYTKRA